MDVQELAAAFFARFKGLDRASGYYGKPPKGKTGEKVKAQAAARGGATVDAWVEHLDGKAGLGVVPICEGNVCFFAAMDVDVYTLDLPKLSRDLAETGLPLLPIRSKSGGVHLYVFFAEPVPASLAVQKLTEWSVALGFGGCEIFPKQVMLTESSKGNWINMPYFDMAATTRYGMRPDGAAMTAWEMLNRAEELALTELQLHAITLAQEDHLEDGPPCLQTLAKTGFPGGSRNNAMFDLAVYARKRYPDDWSKHVEAFNSLYMQPPKDAREINDVIKSVGKKVYAYKCGDQPIVAVCNKQLCLTRRYGVGGANDDPGVVFGDLIKLETDPPTWLWSVNGRDVQLTTEQLLNPRLAQARIAESVNVLPRLIKKTAWDKLIHGKLETLDVQTVPPDATLDGQWGEYLSQFCTQRYVGKALDEVLLNKPYTDLTEKRTFFRSTDFFEFLRKKKVSIDQRKLWTWLRELGGRHHTTTIKGKFVNLWSVPAFSAQTEEFNVPKGEEM